MKFRQRIAWLAVILYLAASFSFVYYIFEINDHFNSLAVDHVRTYHYGDGSFVTSSLWHHLTDIPLAGWLLIFLLPYLQVFGMLLAWTRAEPWRSTAFLWPGIIFNKWKKVVRYMTGQHHGNKAINSTVVFNGNIVIDTYLTNATFCQRSKYASSLKSECSYLNGGQTVMYAKSHHS